MTEIRIYQSLRKNMLWAILCFVCASGGYFILTDHEDRLELYIQVKGTYHTIYFTDVKRFRLIKIQSTKLIAVDYKITSLIHKVDKSSASTQRMMTFNFAVSGAIEGLPAENLTMNGKKICDILNEHLNKNV